jgi:CRP-like cAMP-binding protein
MLRYAHAFLAQTTTAALANGRSKIEERLARWLLMADDRLDGDELPLTHEFLSHMLGTQCIANTQLTEPRDGSAPCRGLLPTRRKRLA